MGGIKKCDWKLKMGLSQKLYFGQHSGKLEIPKSFLAGMTQNLQNTLFNMYTVKKWEKIQIFKYCKTQYFRGHVIFAVGRFCRIADSNFCGCRYGAFY